MSYPEFRLRPSPEAWMNGLILLPFSLTFQLPRFPPASSLPLFQTFSPSTSPKNPYIVYFSISLSLSLPLPSASHFGCLFLPSSLFSLCLSLTPSSLSPCPHAQSSPFTRLPSQLFESFLGALLPQQWTALRELQPCFHSERSSTCVHCDPNFHP